tara:strand:- start:13 stop:999 length:987 start_codon:yes stop_codon:yes gene_type:complete
MKVLAINLSHNTSITQVTDGKIDFHIDETRVRRDKYWHPLVENCFYQSIDNLQDKEFDGVIFCTVDHKFHLWNDSKDCLFVGSGEFPMIENIKRQIPNNKFYMDLTQHHLYHAICGHSFSKNDESIVIVMDAGGGQFVPTYRETESIYVIKDNEISEKWKHYSCMRVNDQVKESGFKSIHQKDLEFVNEGVDIRLSSDDSDGYKFSEMSFIMGLPIMSEGNVMGVSAYGNKNYKTKQKELLSHADRALKLQDETFSHTVELIEKAISYSDCKNIVLSGGYALNCVNNYRYLDVFPHHNFFVDPCPNDGGTSIGAALWLNKNYGEIRWQ